MGEENGSGKPGPCTHGQWHQVEQEVRGHPVAVKLVCSTCPLELKMDDWEGMIKYGVISAKGKNAFTDQK